MHAVGGKARRGARASAPVGRGRMRPLPGRRRPPFLRSSAGVAHAHQRGCTPLAGAARAQSAARCMPQRLGRGMHLPCGRRASSMRRQRTPAETETKGVDSGGGEHEVFRRRRRARRVAPKSGRRARRSVARRRCYMQALLRAGAAWREGWQAEAGASRVHGCSRGWHGGSGAPRTHVRGGGGGGCMCAHAGAA